MTGIERKLVMHQAGTDYWAVKVLRIHYIHTEKCRFNRGLLPCYNILYNLVFITNIHLN